MAKNSNSEFEFNYNLNSDTYVNPNAPCASVNRDNPYNKVFLTAYSKRFVEIDEEVEAKCAEEERSCEDCTAPVCSEVVEEAESEVLAAEEAEAEAPAEVRKITTYKKNKAVITFGWLFALLSLGVLVAMFAKIMVPQLFNIKDTTGSLLYIQIGLLVAAVLLLATVITGIVQLATKKKRRFMAIPAFFAFIILAAIAVLCIMQFKIVDVRFDETFINYKKPLEAYAYAFVVDIPCGYFIALFLSLISFILSCCGYTKVGENEEFVG